MFPLAGATTAAFYTDTPAARGITNDPATLQRNRNISNYTLGAMMGVGAGAYILGRISHDDHKRETGVLAAEAVADTLAVNTVFKYSFGRERPFVDDGRGKFFQGGDSFPSDHATAAWAAASVYAHEYPGALTQFFAYGLASAVSISRVAGKEHFPSDVIVGSAIGLAHWARSLQIASRSGFAGEAVREALPELMMKIKGNATTWDLLS